MKRAIEWGAFRVAATAVALASGACAGTLLFALKMPASAASPSPSSSAGGARALPLFFVESPGEPGRFTAGGKGYGIRIDGGESSLALLGNTTNPGGTATHVITSKLVGSNPNAVARGEKQLPARISKFTGSDPKHWRTDLRAFEQVRTVDAYAGIDLVHYGRERALEYDFVVKRGARPETIRLQLEGVEEIAINPAGDLEIETPHGTLLQRRPYCYQERNGERVQVAGSFVLAKGNQPQVGFQVADYDTSKPLVIDPVLEYSTYLAGAGLDEVTGVETDSRGRIYLTGPTFSPDFPTTSGLAQGDQFTVDAFLAVIDPSRSGAASLVYGSYIGGAGSDQGFDVAVDPDGLAYVTGFTTSANFPTTSGAFQNRQGTFDAFLTVLNPARSGIASLVFSSPLGGGGNEEGISIALDGLGRAHLTGDTTSTDFPVTAGAVQSSLAGSGQDAFVAVINVAGNGVGSIAYATYLGGAGFDNAFAVDADSAGRSYTTGYTASHDFPTTPSRLNGRVPPFFDAYVTVIDPSESGAAALDYSTFLSGASEDGGRGIAVGADGLVHVVGITYSSDFPTTTTRLQGDLPDADATLTVLDPSESGIGALVYSTYLGGAGLDVGEDLALTDAGQAVVAGITASSDFPITPGALQTQRSKDEGFVTLVDPRKTGAASLLYSTFLGGEERDWCLSVAIDRMSRVCVGGLTDSLDFPTSATRLQVDPGDSGTDGFVTVLDFLIEPPSALTAVLESPSSVRLTWTDNSLTEEGFQIERRTKTSAFAPIAQVGTDVTTFTDTTVAPNTVYTYRVRAVRTGRVTAYSNSATVTTPKAVGGTLDVPLELNFGRVKRRKEKRATITLKNTHPSQSLTGTVGGTTRGFKVVEGGGAFELKPGETRQVTLAVKSGRRGALRGTLTIESSDSKRPMVEVALRAKVR